MKKRILTGDRPTGQLHIGHYFGALQNRVKLQEEYDTFVLVADVQALTDNFNNPEKVHKNVFEITCDNLAVGVNPEVSTILIQSLIPEIAELTVFYSNLVTVARLQRNPTVKEEIKQKKELFADNVTYGFLGYPVSQAADITAFGAQLVPCGEDQLPLIEQTREIVRKFNSIYGDILVEPEALVGEIRRVKGLDGNAKMGKSLNNAIYLADDSDAITKKVMSAITDTNKIRLNDKGNPNNCMVHYYHKMFTQVDELKEVTKECKAGTRGCVQCKRQLACNIANTLEPIREKRNYYHDRPKLVEDILYSGTNKAREVAIETMKMVREKMQLDYFNKK